MNETRRIERRLATLYCLGTASSTVSVVSLVIAWQHWAWTLNSCIDVHCECILYGVDTFGTFMGGDVKLCNFAAYAPAPGILLGLVLACYHGYRSWIDRDLERPRVIRRPGEQRIRNQASGDGVVVVVGPGKTSPCKQWIPAGFLAALLSCLALAHAIVLTDGYYKTCEQYRRTMIELLGSRGREAEVIHARLSCGTILDYMDYLQPDANNWRRGDEINTGVSLQLAIVSGWFNFFIFLSISVLNFAMARRRHREECFDEETRRCC